jgi:hypothetical protein
MQLIMLEPVSQFCNSTEKDGSSTTEQPTRTRCRPVLHGFSACRGLANILMAAQYASGRQDPSNNHPFGPPHRDSQPGCCLCQAGVTPCTLPPPNHRSRTASTVLCPRDFTVFRPAHLSGAVTFHPLSKDTPRHMYFIHSTCMGLLWPPRV